MTDFLLELRSEEIPARMQARARDDLARLFAAELARAGLQASGIATYATPRRLALIARDLPDETAAVSEEIKGPKTSAPPQALEGFLRKTGLTRNELTERDGVLFAVKEVPGRPTAAILSDCIFAVVHGFPWPKSMRWGAQSRTMTSLRWVRPLHGIVALFGAKVVPANIDGIESGAATVGHRFHHPGQITIGSAADYVEKLRACHVIVDQAEREALIRDRAAKLAREAGLDLVEDEGLVAENAGLTEWPVPLLGRFDRAFLDVPPEVIQLTARVNQKYLVCRDTAGTLANAFICTANIDATDGDAAIVEGNRKVLAARLSDARFFYEQDLKVPLDEQAKKLDRIVFHEKLGTVADKVNRVAKLARWLIEEEIVRSSPQSGEGDHLAQPNGGGALAHSGLPSSEAPPPRPTGAVPLPASGEDREELAALADRAARLCKADLVTGMVGEFPELQGIMGGYYARAQGEDPRVADAIRDHYKPVGQGDAVPTAPVTVAVSLADKLDTLSAFFFADLPPTGSKDPFALRRAALAVIRILVENDIRLELSRPLSLSVYSLWSLIERSIDDEPHSLAWSYLRFAGIEPDNELAARLADIWVERRSDLSDWLGRRYKEVSIELADFFADRLKVQQREAGVRHDLIDAVFALGGEDDLVRLLARVHALQAFIGTEDGANLLTGYRRAANILKKEGYAQAEETRHPGLEPGSSPDLAATAGDGVSRAGQAWMPAQGRHDDEALSYTPEPAEDALRRALDAAEPQAAEAVAAERFDTAMAALASLRAPIDAFFDSVTVNASDAAKRAARLALLARVRDAVHTVADFSRIEG